MQSITYILQKDLDKSKWDACIATSANGLVYAYSWYLDAMSNNWDALILNDYETVMPLTWNKKYGVNYLHQPHFCASLGVFSKKEIRKEYVLEFLNAIPAKFKYWDFYLNHQNLFSISKYPLTERTNYVLSLHNSYESISSTYRSNLKRNIKKAAESKLTVKQGIDITEITKLASKKMQSISNISTTDFENFKSVFTKAKEMNCAETLGIYLNDELLASAVFLFSHNRWYYILVGNHPNGKTLGASHYLIDRFIHFHAGENSLLDFEGSDIRNLAFFYSSYGASEEKYPAIRMNKLPGILKWMKD